MTPSSLPIPPLGFIPHGYCYLWEPWTVGLNVGGDLLISLAYFSIPALLLGVLRKRSDVPFNGMVLCFAAFIIACGVTHLVEVWNVWHGDFFVAGVLKTITAVISIGTACYLFWLRPQMLQIPSPQQLARMNQQMQERMLEQRRTADALRESEQRFRSTFETTGIGMAIVGLDGRIERANQKLTEIFGRTEAQLQQLTFREITHPDDLAESVSAFASVREGRTNGYQTDRRYLHADGRTVWTRLTVTAVRDAESRPLHLVAQIENIDERKQLERSLADARDRAIEASRLKSEFLANMSHEIRTPMNGVIGMGALLAETKLEPSQREMLEVMQSSSEALMRIINDILDFSKIEAGKLDLHVSSFDLHSLVEKALMLVRPRAAEKCLSVTLEFDDDLRQLPLLGDAGRIRQVLLNLLNNAIRFTEQGGITLRVLRTAFGDEQVGFRIEVEDTGIGIPAAAQERLFHAFSQVDGSSTRRFGGTGLGLAISRQLVDLMGGVISFRSQENQGSTFWFALSLPRAEPLRAALLVDADGDPVAATIPTDTPIAPALGTPPPCRRLKVLIAEDNRVNIEVIKRMLSHLRHSWDVATDGEQALDALRASRYDALLLDCQMPVMDGYEVARQVRAGSTGEVAPRLPIIALTAHALPHDREKCLQAGMDDYLSKPLRIEDLAAALARNVAPA